MLEIKLEVSKALLRQGATVAQVEQELAPSIAKALALAIKGRVSTRGDLAGQRFPGYDSTEHNAKSALASRGMFPVSGRLPNRGGKETKSGAVWYASSEAMHRAFGVVDGSYNVTGGMWAGLTEMIMTPTLVRMLFRGRSEGHAPRFVNGKSRPIKVSNSLKAATVLQQHGVNLLALSERELEGVGRGVTLAMAAGISVQLPVKWEGQAPPSGDLFAVLSRAIAGG